MKIFSWFKENYLLIAILCVAAVLRVYHIDYFSLWMDEVNTINEANPNYSLSEVYQAILDTDGASPPLFFFITHFVFKIFGYTSFVLRMISVIYGIAGVLMIYILGKEILSKRAGLYAAILLTVNYYHLAYSQEARFYAFLFLVTTISFYALIRFIKKPTYLTAIFYGISAALMLYGHFFAMFTLCAQYLILLYFVIKPYSVNRIKFFLYSFISGVTTIVLFLPFTYDFLVKTSEIKKTYISAAGLDFFTQLLSEFFGKSEIILFFVLILVFLFFVQLSKARSDDRYQIDPNKNKMVFAFFILFIWTIITILLPLVRSYTTVPMLQNRYLIGILPAIIIIISIGLFYIRSEITRLLILSTIVVFSINDIVLVKSYYTVVRKDEFREVTSFVSKNNIKNEPVVSNRIWYMTYYFRDEKFKLIDSKLEDYVNEMIKGTAKKYSFWYAGAGEEVAKISKEAQLFLDKNFEIENNADFYGLWAKHYVNVTNATPEYNISKYDTLKKINGDEFMSYIDSYQCKDGEINIEGYAFFKDQDSEDSQIEILMIGEKKAFKLQNQKVNRHDVTNWFKSQYDLDHSGFKVNLLSNNLLPGKYQLAILLKNKKTNKEGLILTENFYTKE